MHPADFPIHSAAANWLEPGRFHIRHHELQNELLANIESRFYFTPFRLRSYLILRDVPIQTFDFSGYGDLRRTFSPYFWLSDT